MKGNCKSQIKAAEKAKTNTNPVCWQYEGKRRAYFRLPNVPGYKYSTGTLHLFPGNNEEGLAFDLALAKENCYFHVLWAGPLLPVVVAYHPDSLRHILKSSAPKPRSPILSTPYDMGLPWLGEGLIISNGDRWARSRRLLTPAFHFDILKPYLEIYNQCADILIKKMEHLSKQGQAFDIYTLLNLDALDIILRCAFSYMSECQTVGLKNNIASVISELGKMWSDRSISPHFHDHIDFLYRLTSHGKRFYKLCNVAHKASEEIITKRKQELEKDPDLVSKKKLKDFLDILLTAKDEDGQGLSPLEIRNEVDTFFFAGHDTTASGMTWIIYALAGHPECQEKVYNEVTKVLDGREYLEWNDLQNLEYTTMCIKESLRLHGAVTGIERKTTEECNVHGHVIPAGTRVGIHLWILHHNPHIWDHPNDFRPERFHPNNLRNMDPFQFVPFSAGPSGQRYCLLRWPTLPSAEEAYLAATEEANPTVC
ncbi:Cytochrome P450 4F4 [Bulinus truncatus]|nr:Cytochrome P450 4F4 [Bulinus truncatus]